MFRWLERLSTAERLMQFGERLLKWVPPILGMLGLAGLGGWSTAAANVFEQYKPFSWVFGAFGGALVFMVLVNLWLLASAHIGRMQYAKQMATRPAQVNPLATVFTNECIDLNAFRPMFPSEAVKGKTFVDCELRGPCVILLVGNSLVQGVEAFNCDFIKIKPATVFNCMALKDVTITRGRMLGITLLVQEASAPMAEQGMRGLEWLNP